MLMDKTSARSRAARTTSVPITRAGCRSGSETGGMTKPEIQMSKESQSPKLELAMKLNVRECPRQDIPKRSPRLAQQLRECITSATQFLANLCRQFFGLFVGLGDGELGGQTRSFVTGGVHIGISKDIDPFL